MSYDLFIFHPNVKLKADQGLELDEFEHTPLAIADIDAFIARLEKYGYSLESENPKSKEFIRLVDTCPIQVAVFSTEIAFSIPYWAGSDTAIFEALQDASELSDSDGLVLYDPQSGEWQT